MTAQRTYHEMEKFKLLKAVRATVRLRKSIEADYELNEILPRLEAEFDKAIARGEAYELDTLSLMADDLS